MKKIILINFVLIQLSLMAQIFRPAAQGLQFKPFFHQQSIQYHLCSSDTNSVIYNLYYDTVSSGFEFGKEYSQVRLKIFNGFTWLSTSPIKLYSKNSIDAPRVLSIYAGNEMVYIGGSFDSSEYDLGAGLIAWKKSGEWVNIGAQLNSVANSSIEVNKICGNSKNQLLISGYFDSLNNTLANGIAYYDGLNWLSLGSGANKGYQESSQQSDMVLFCENDSFYLHRKGTHFTDSFVVGGETYRAIAVLKGTGFEQGSKPIQRIGYLSTENEALSVFQISKLYYINSLYNLGTGTNKRFSDLDSFYISNYVGHHRQNEKDYYFFQKPGIGVKIYRADDTELSLINSFKPAENYINLQFISSKNEAVLAGNITKIETEEFTRSMSGIVRIDMNKVPLIHVTTFLDLNQNGSYDTGEPPVENCMISETSGLFSGLTDKAGQLFIEAQKGLSYSFIAQNHLGYFSSTQKDILALIDSTYHIYFPFRKELNPDVSIQIFSGTGTRAKQGFVTRYLVELNNASDEEKQLNILIKHPPKLSSLNTDHLQIQSFSEDFFIYKQTIPAHTQLFTPFEAIYGVNDFALEQFVSVVASFSLNDRIKSNNQDSLTQKVVAAYDPNEKTAYPGEVVESNKRIKYMIQFENLGNDTALNVTVVDTFQSLLGLSEVILGGCSHPNYTVRVENNCIIWSFERINLPPTKVNSVKSKGYVTFNCPLNQSAKKGDTILNKAAIFFDYQKPVITNDAKVVYKDVNSVDEFMMGQKIQVYPNPTQTYFYIHPDVSEAIITAVDGAQIKIECQASGEFAVPASLSTGIYMIEFEIKGIKNQRKLCIIQ